MRWLIKWIKRKTWWRKYYKIVTLSDIDAWHGRCTFCDASLTHLTDIPRCNASDKECPCKWNQCLTRKNLNKL